MEEMKEQILSEAKVSLNLCLNGIRELDRRKTPGGYLSPAHQHELAMCWKTIDKIFDSLRELRMLSGASTSSLKTM